MGTSNSKGGMRGDRNTGAGGAGGGRKRPRDEEDGEAAESDAEIAKRLHRELNGEDDMGKGGSDGARDDAGVAAASPALTKGESFDADSSGDGERAMGILMGMGFERTPQTALLLRQADNNIELAVSMLVSQGVSDAVPAAGGGAGIAEGPRPWQLSRASASWFFAVSDGWKRFDAETAQEMEAALAAGHSSLRTTIRDAQYELDLRVMRQTNVRTGRVRQLKRISPYDEQAAASADDGRRGKALAHHQESESNDRDAHTLGASAPHAVERQLPSPRKFHENVDEDDSCLERGAGSAAGEGAAACPGSSAKESGDSCQPRGSGGGAGGGGGAEGSEDDDEMLMRILTAHERGPREIKRGDRVRVLGDVEQVKRAFKARGCDVKWQVRICKP